MNIIRAVFEKEQFSVTATRPDGKPIHQWDYGQVLQIHGLDLAKATEVHFSHSMLSGDATIRIGNTADKITTVVIPEKFLETSGTVAAFVYTSSAESGQTEYKIRFQIVSRSKPEAWDSPEDAELFRQTIEAVNSAADRAKISEDSAKASADIASEVVVTIDDVKAAAEQAKSELVTATTTANTTKSALNGTIDTANQSKAGLITATENANTATDNANDSATDANSAVDRADAKKASLDGSITLADQKKSNLDASIDTAVTAKSNLDSATSTANTAKSNLDGSISDSATAKSNLDSSVPIANTARTNLSNTITSAESKRAEVQGVINAGNTLKTDLTAQNTTATTNITSLQTEISNAETTITAIQAEGAKQIASIISSRGDIENVLINYFALRRNNKVFTTKLYKYSVSTSPTGEKLNDNAGMVCQPSVGTVEGRNDYKQYGLFQHFTCNWTVDANGFNHVTFLEGQTGFSKTGKVQVGEVTMGGWFGIEDTGDSVLYHYSAVKTTRTPQPMKETINPDGTINPLMIHAKYMAVDIDGKPYSSKGKPVAVGGGGDNKPMSYTGMIDYMHKHGMHYCGTTCADIFYLQLMFIIKYATKNSQSVMAGCSSYDSQFSAVVAETSVKRVILSKANANSFVVGSYVSVGEIGANSNKDRNLAYMHNLAYAVKITKIENVDATNTAIYVDTPTVFNTTLTTWISSMPWITGSTDEVVGSDGSPVSNTNGIYPCKLQGIEYSTGLLCVLGNTFTDIVTGQDGNPALDVYVCENASLLTSNVASAKTTYKKVSTRMAYTAGAWRYVSVLSTDINRAIMIPVETNGSNATGWCDGLSTDSASSGQREWLSLGNLNVTNRAGLWYIRNQDSLLSAKWEIASYVSPNGTRGEYTP